MTEQIPLKGEKKKGGANNSHVQDPAKNNGTSHALRAGPTNAPPAGHRHGPIVTNIRVPSILGSVIPTLEHNANKD